jgi:hypothetical protein
VCFLLNRKFCCTNNISTFVLHTRTHTHRERERERERERDGHKSHKSNHLLRKKYSLSQLLSHNLCISLPHHIRIDPLRLHQNGMSLHHIFESGKLRMAM